jgi:hypothetical protein
VIPPPGKCVWGCDSGQPLDREHIIAKHVAAALDVPYPVPMSWGDLRRATGERIERGQREENALEIVLPDRVCKGCNGGWMKKLDDRMLRFMWPTFRHEARVRLNRRSKSRSRDGPTR